MTTARSLQSPSAFCLPDPPEIPDEKATAARHLSLTGNAYYLSRHLGNPETTIVGAELYIVPIPTAERADMSGVVYPDLLVAFNADPAMYLAQNGYVISEQGKPPDFVLEVASRSTGRRDTVDKRIAYAELGIPEYWRFDQDGRFHGARLAGDRLVDRRYESIQIDELPDGSLQGHSVILNLDLRWTDGQLAWYDPATGRARCHPGVGTPGSFQEREARLQAEARVRDLEDQLRELRGE